MSETTGMWALLYATVLIILGIIFVDSERVRDRQFEASRQAFYDELAARQKAVDECWKAATPRVVYCGRTNRIVNRRWNPRQARYRADTVAADGHYWYAITESSSECGIKTTRTPELAEPPEACADVDMITSESWRR